jgi:RHS repeat-associated protein
VQASSWRGRWSDISGLVWLGARYYDPVAGQFLSSDPVWNGRDPNYYTFCGGDPINYFDADGRLGKSWVEHSQSVNVNSIGSFFDASFSGAAGAILQGIGSIPSVFGQAREGMVQANQEISTYSGGQAFLANTLRLPANFAFGTTTLINDPVTTMPQIPRGVFVDFPSSVVHNVGDFANNPSIYGAFNLVENGIQAAALVEGGAALYRTGIGLIPPRSISTPYGPAIQASTAEAQALLQQVQDGATVYKGGFLGRSEAGASQFLSLENPLNPGFAVRYGIPPQNANFNFVLTGRVQPGAPVITRPAPPVPPNPGGALEAVTTPGSFRIDSFHMP